MNERNAGYSRFSAYYLSAGEALQGSPGSVAVVLLARERRKLCPLQNVRDEGGEAMDAEQLVLTLTLIVETVSMILQIIEYTDRTKINRPSRKD